MRRSRRVGRFGFPTSLLQGMIFPREHEVVIQPRTTLDPRWTLPGSIFPREGKPARAGWVNRRLKKISAKPFFLTSGMA